MPETRQEVKLRNLCPTTTTSKLWWWQDPRDPRLTSLRSVYKSFILTIILCKDLSRSACNGNTCTYVSDSVYCALLTFTCVSLLGNAYDFLNEINIYKWSGSFLGYCLCGATERRRKANSLWFPSQNFASLHQG